MRCASYMCSECECHKCCDNNLIMVAVLSWGVSDAVDPIGSSIVKWPFGSWSLQITRYCCTRGIGNSDASRHIFQRKLLWYCNMDLRMCVVILNYCPNWKCGNYVIRMNCIWVTSVWGMGNPLWALYFRSVLLRRLLKKNGSKESEVVLFGIFAFCCSYNTDGRCVLHDLADVWCCHVVFSV